MSKFVGALIMATPTVAFVVALQFASLQASIAFAVATALALLAVRFAQRTSLKQPLIGVGLVVACAIGAVVTDEARGFFLVPALIPLVVTCVCITTIVIGRPLTGLLLNRVAGGPADWRERSVFSRIYASTTWSCAGLDAINFAIQVLFYRRNDTTVLAIAHVATGPLFAVIVAWTIAMVRRERSIQAKGGHL